MPTFQGKTLRHELKYYLHVHEYTALRARISTMLPLDSHASDLDGYGVRSLYFDGPLHHSLYDKNNGIFRRDKYRIRIYDGSDRRIMLERKSKYGDYIRKESAALTRDEYEQIMSGKYEFLSVKEHPLLRDFYRLLVHGYYKPAVIVDYKREAYVYEWGNVRVTFDKHLSAGVNSVDLFDPDLALQEALPPPLTIMEIKYDSYLPDVVRQLVRPDTHNRSAISKFVICREVAIMHLKE